MIVSSMLFALSLQAATCSCDESFSDIPIIGHRGAGSSNSENRFAENTLPAIDHAFRLGAEYVEVDIHLSNDREVILMHDFQVDETTNLKGCVRDFSYAQLSTADATRGSGATDKVGVPLLRDVLALATKNGRKVNIEIKVDEAGKTCAATDINLLVTEAIKVVIEQGASDRVFFSSFSFAALELVKKSLPTVPVGYLTSEGGERLLGDAKRALAARFEAINPIYFVLTEDAATFSALGEMELQIIPWTVNDEEGIKELLLSGADAIITDDLALAIRVRDETALVCACAPTTFKKEEPSGCQTSNPLSLFPAYLAVVLLAGLRRYRFIWK